MYIRIRMIVLIIIIVIIQLSLCACSDTSVATPDGVSLYLARATLSNEDIELYDDICKRIKEYQLSFVFINVQESRIIKAYLAVINDHPEFFWMSGGYSYKKTTFGNITTLEFSPISWTDISKIKSQNEEFNRALQQVVHEIETKNLPYERIIYIHDLLIDKTTYDEDTYELMGEQQESNIIYEASTAYGCLVSHKAVCSGYSAAFQLLMQKAGIPCGRVSGQKIGGGNHEWNYVSLEGEFYYIDVTWDDPISYGIRKQEADVKTYEFFMITTEELKKTHIIASDQLIPECNGTKYDYYKYYGLYFTDYDFNKVAEIIKTKIASGSISIKFAYEAERRKAVTDLFENKKIFDINGIEGKVAYSSGNDGLVLTLWFN